MASIFDTQEAGASSSTVPTQYDLMTPQQKALFDALLAQSQKGLEEGPTPYPGQLHSPENPREAAFFAMAGQPSAGYQSSEARNAALARILSGEQGYSPSAGVGQSYLNAAYPYNTADPLQMGAREDILTGTPSYTVDPAVREKYYQESFYNPAMREYQQNILPQTMEAASGAGFHSSDTLQNMAKAGGDVETALAALRGNLLWQDVQSGYAAEESAAERMLKLLGGEQVIGADIASRQAQLSWNEEAARAAASESALERLLRGVQSEGTLGMQEAQLSEAMQGRIGAELGTAGALQRQIDNEKLAGDLSRWLSGEPVGGVRSNIYNPYNQQVMAILGITPYGYGTTTTAQGEDPWTAFLRSLGYSVGAGAVTYATS